MRPLPLSKIIAAVGGSPDTAGSEDPIVTGISTDSRKVGPGELFIPLSGDRFDGHEFIQGAFERGALASLASRDVPLEPGRCIVRVADTLAALEAFALRQRQELDFEVTAITGSVGKTTTKEFLRDILGSECAVAAAPKSFNNRLGVALTLLEAGEETRHLVVEMGTSGKGELSYLSNRVRPERILITTVTEAHIKGLGDLAGVIEAKAEILEGLAPGGQVYLNPATPGFGEFCSRLDRKPRTFGTPDADFPLELNRAAGAVDAVQTFRVCGEEYAFELPGEHNVINASGAIAVALDLGLSPEAIRRGLALCRLPPGRLNVEVVSEVLFVDDSYNANPCSMEAAFDTFEELCGRTSGGRNIAVLGEMCELGARSRDFHEKVGRLLAGKPMDLLVTVGGSSLYLGEAFAGERERLGHKNQAATRHFEELSPAREYLSEELRPGDRVLFKASNSVGLGKCAEQLRETVSNTEWELPLV
ncbi:MAG: UDP-N-acetylmuramoyl-tripeptide--D-alanyl-D-alanine ligase [Planctomycetota bacterium]|nr:UDP-N-acetylmuramoyl-tripeptide--D-alanyl-D-alanine ligase [Planctomycetota bacterium]